MKLILPEFHTGRKKAEDYILYLCKQLELPISTKDGLANEIRITTKDKTIIADLPKEVEAVRKTGKAYTLQIIFDSRDRFLNTPLSLGMIGDEVGIKVEINSSYGGHSSSIQMPGIIEAPEVSFTEDIIYHRQAVVAAFNIWDLPGLARHYRSYLFSCISLVECFLHRYTFHIKEIVPSFQEYHNTATLNTRCSIEKRMDAWLETFAYHKLDEFRNSKQRSKFMELKCQRNIIVHPILPTISYGVRDVVKYLNCAKDGIGGLLSELRKYTGYTENIGFIRQISTLPDIIIEQSHNG